MKRSDSLRFNIFLITSANCSYWTYFSAGTTVNTLIVNIKLGITFGYCTNRTYGSTRTTFYTFTTNYIHIILSPPLLTIIIPYQFRKKTCSISILYEKKKVAQYTLD